jgi:hypothetical protein
MLMVCILNNKQTSYTFSTYQGAQFKFFVSNSPTLQDHVGHGLEKLLLQSKSEVTKKFSKLRKRMMLLQRNLQFQPRKRWSRGFDKQAIQAYP